MRGSLRGRLLAGLLILVVAVLGAVDLVTWSALRSFLVSRVDNELAATPRPVNGSLAQLATLASPSADLAVLRRVAPPGVFVQLRTGDGRVLATLTVANSAGNAVNPAVPNPLPEPSGGDASDVVTVRAARGAHGRFRLQVFPSRSGATLVAAAPLAPVDDTLHRLVLVELIASGIAVVAVVLLALFVVNLGLRPLDAMADTAAAIAGGDPTRRVPAANPRNEVGRLGLALNAMLGQIDAAFANRSASEERLRRFVSDASHELRTPLTSIRGYAELFRSGASERPDDLAKAMGRIESEAARMSELLEDLLLLARLDQGRPLDVIPVDLAALAADAAADAGVAGQEVTVDAPVPVVVAGDEYRLRQVAANLLANARQHTPPGTRVFVRAAVDGAFGAIEVADQGAGLSAEQLDRVWDRFWRAERTPRAGSGLGLSIVMAIALAHGGRATVRSERGAGTTFRVEIPLAGDG